MKFQSLVNFTSALAIALLVGCGANSVVPSASPESPEAAETTEVEQPVSEAPATPVAEATESAGGKSGTFVAAEHPTSGTATIITENGMQYVEFDTAFVTDEGPDLFVLLHQDEVPEAYTAESYVSLGELQQIEGTQRYAIPEGVNPDDFRSVVIWCRQFNATFGYAPLAAQ